MQDVVSDFWCLVSVAACGSCLQTGRAVDSQNKSWTDALAARPLANLRITRNNADRNCGVRPKGSVRRDARRPWRLGAVLCEKCPLQRSEAKERRGGSSMGGPEKVQALPLVADWDLRAVRTEKIL